MSTSVSIAELLRKIDAGERFLLLDVRNDEEYARWRVEGRRPVDTVHQSYFAFIEDEALLDSIPRDRGPIFAICAKGDSSDLIAGMLRERGAEAYNVAGGMVAYGEWLQAVRVAVPSDGLEIWQMNRRGKGCLSYVIRMGQEAIVVDPSRHIGDYERFGRITAVFDTHVHADHLSGGAALARKHGARYNEPVPGVKVFKSPGHTPAAISLLAGEKYLFTGDTLFVDSVGRPDLGGHVVEWGKMLYHTLTERYAFLSDDVWILPAHYASASEIGADGVVCGRLGELRRTVPELQLRSEADFVDAMKRAIKPAPAIYEKIIRVNLGEQTVDEETATEWELGKNQCAARMAS